MTEMYKNRFPAQNKSRFMTMNAKLHDFWCCNFVV